MLPDPRSRTDPVLNHRDLGPPNRIVPVPSHKVRDPGLNRIVPVLSSVGRGPNRMVLVLSSADQGPNRKVLVLPNQQVRHRTRRVRMNADQVLHRMQGPIHMPAPDRRVVGCSARDSASADHATAVDLIQLGAAANSSLTPVAFGDRVVKFHVSV